MDENNFTFSGIKYVAIPQMDERNPCVGCAFAPNEGRIRLCGCIKSPNCSPIGRQDELSIIWVEAEEQDDES
jgi:hypothetical protein